MSITLATRTQIAVALTYGTGREFSDVSNGTAPGFSFGTSDPSLGSGGYFHVRDTGWPFLADAVLQIGTTTGTNPYVTTMAGRDTSGTGDYPGGEGAGTGFPISAWQTIARVGDATVDGGETALVDTPELASPVVGRLPGDRSGVVLRMPVYFEKTLSAGLAAAIAAQKAGVPYGIRITHPSGDSIYAAGFWSVRRFPTLTRGQPRSSEVICAIAGVEESFFES